MKILLIGLTLSLSVTANSRNIQCLNLYDLPQVCTSEKADAKTSYLEYTTSVVDENSFFIDEKSFLDSQQNNEECKQNFLRECEQRLNTIEPTSTFWKKW